MGPTAGLFPPPLFALLLNSLCLLLLPIAYTISIALETGMVPAGERHTTWISLTLLPGSPPGGGGVLAWLGTGHLFARGPSPRCLTFPVGVHFPSCVAAPSAAPSPLPGPFHRCGNRGSGRLCLDRYEQSGERWEWREQIRPGLLAFSQAGPSALGPHCHPASFLPMMHQIQRVRTGQLLFSNEAVLWALKKNTPIVPSITLSD